MKKRLGGQANICLITTPVVEIIGKTGGGDIQIERMLHILEPLATEIYLIDGNYPQSAVFSPKIHLRNVKTDSKKQAILIRTLKYIRTQLRISYNLVRIANKIDICVFFVGAMAFSLPMLSAKLLRKRTVLIATGSVAKSAEQQYKDRFFGKGGFIFSRILEILETINRNFADRIVVESPSLVSELGLNKYENKVSGDGAIFTDMDFFRSRKKLNERKKIVGYMGSLIKKKGVMNFTRAIPLILSQDSGIEFLIGGKGQLRSKIENELKSNKCNSKTELTGFMDYDDLPEYFSELKLLVFPSYTEGLPNIVLEAMACGTPVLATPVGGVPDVIKNGETGFILEDNSPECIAKNVIRALGYPKLDEIARNARALVEKKYAYGAAVERYKKIFGKVHYIV